MSSPKRLRATAIVEWARDGRPAILVHANRDGTWLLPGGGIEPGELPLAAVARELREETGLIAHAAVFLFQHESHVNQHHVFLVRAGGALAIQDPREVPAIGLYRQGAPIATVVGAPLPADTGALASGAQAILERYQLVRGARADLLGVMGGLPAPEGANAIAVAATRADWPTAPPPEDWADLPAARLYRPAEMARLRRGLVPRRMEDRWFAYVEGETLYLHRSWTGLLVYAVSFAQVGDGYVISRARAARGPDLQGRHDPADEARDLIGVIDAILQQP